MANRIVGHISWDSTSIDARENRLKNALKDKPPKKRGRPQKGGIRTKEPTRLERQKLMGLDAMLEAFTESLWCWNKDE